MPEITQEEIDYASTGTFKFIIFGVLPLQWMGIGLGIASIIHYVGDKEKFESKIEMIVAYEMHWLYYSWTIFSYLVLYLNSYATLFKERIMREESGAVRSNMFIYKMAAPGQTQSRVVLVSDGFEGNYNRSNRSLYHFLENVLSLAVAIPMTTVVYPIPTFVCTVIYFIARLIYTTKYSLGGYGKHTPFYVIFTFTHFTVIGFVMLINIRSWTKL